MRSRIDEETLAVERAFERQIVGMAVAGLIIRSDRADVEKDAPRRAVPDRQSCLCKMAPALGKRGIEGVTGLLEQAKNRVGRHLIVKSCVVEERDVPVRMPHPAAEFGHSQDRALERVPHVFVFDEPREDEKILHHLQVIERAAFEVSAVVQNLLDKLTLRRVPSRHAAIFSRVGHQKSGRRTPVRRRRAPGDCRAGPIRYFGPDSSACRQRLDRNRPRKSPRCDHQFGPSSTAERIHQPSRVAVA